MLAYEHAGPRRGIIYAAILELYTLHGQMVDDDLYRAYLNAGYPLRSRPNIGTARCELADAGKVVHTGTNGLSDLGNPAKLWDTAPSNEGANGDQ